MVSIVSGNGLGFSNSSLTTLGQRAAQGNAAQGRGNEQVFVNVATGNLVISDTDDRLVAHGGGYEAVRTYNSQGLLNDDNGDNWGTGFYRRQLVLSGQAGQAGSTITLTGRDGSTSLFTWDSGSSRYISTDGAQAYDRIESTNAGFIWTGGQSQRREYYGASTGRLDKTVDASGSATTYSYDADGNIAKVAGASGESVQYDYAGGLLMRVRAVDSQGKAVTRTSYAYDALKRLSAVTVDLTPADGSTTDGKLYRTSYTYDGDSRRVASVQQSDGTQLSIEYVQSGADYRVSVLRDALGQTYRFSYDASARTTQVTDPAGQVSAYAYDAKGQLLSIASSGPGGARLVQRFEYNGNGDLVRTTDADGRSVFMAYDARGNQVLQRDAVGNTVTRTFNAQNQLLTETVYTQPDPDGDGAGQPSGALTSRYVYDDASGTSLRFMISAEGRVTEYRRNTYGEAVAVLQHHAAAYPVSSLARDAVPTEATVSSWASKQNLQQVRRTDYAFDYRGQMQTATSYASTDTSGNGVSAGSSVVRYVYDPVGRLLQSIDGKGATTAYAYDGLGRLISTTDGLGQLASTVYDDEGARIVTQAANGLRETRVYDRAGRLVSSQRSDATSADLGTNSFIYDTMGRLRSSQDATGSRSWVLYDEAGRKSAEVGASGALREYVYNGSGQVIRVIAYATPVDVRSLTAADGSPAAVTVAALRPAGAPADRSDWTIYDAAGRVWKTVGADGSVTENFYDGLSRLIATRQYAKTIATAALGDAPAASAASPSPDASADRVTRYFYDADGLRTGTLDAEGYLVLNAYDPAGRLASTTRFARLTDASKRAAGTLQDLKPATNSQDIVERRLYDEKHQLVGQIDGAGYLTAFEYDANGNLAKQVRYATALKASVLSSVTTASPVSQIRPATSAQDQVRLYDYDALGRLAAETDYQGTRTEHAYDAAGNRIRSTAAAGTDQSRTRLARYDSQGRLVAELSAEGARQLAAAQTPAQIEAVWSSYAKIHAYDLAGRRSATIDANGLRTLFFYNASGQLTHTVNALGEVSETRYDALGQTVAEIRYGTRINPGELIGSQAGGLVNNKLLALLQGAANPALDQVTRTSYGAAGTVAGTTDAAGFSKNYAYNAFREEIQRTEATGTGAASTTSLTRYDRRGLVAGQTRDAVGLAAVSTYKYDAFGNQISATDALGRTRTRTFDKLGREVTSTDAVWATLTTKYDAFNRVVSQLNAEGNTTTYAYDAKNRTVTISTDEGLLVKQTYNRHGDMIEVSDARASVTRYSYDADGRQTGSSQDVWHFDSNITETVTTGKGYDRAGRLVETTDANGKRTTIAYDAANRVLTRTVDAGGLSLATQYAYDPLGRQISITQPGGTVTTLRYDAKGQLVEQVVDPAGLALSTRYAYDAQGHTLEVIRPEGTRTRYTYDNAGRRISEQVDPDGLNLTRTYTYDLLDNLTSSVDANGNTSYYLYDDENRQTLAIDGSGSVTQTSYDALGRISKLVEYRNPITDTALLQRYVAGGANFGPGTWESQVRESLVPAGTDRIEYRSYDANNYLQSVVNGLGEVTTFLRDNNGRVMEQRSFANRIAVGGADGWTPGTLPTPAPDDARDVRTRMAYDPLGRLIVKVDGTGAATKFRYDGAGNVVEQVRYAKPISITVPWYDESFVFLLANQEGAPANVVEKSTYDAAQRLIWKSDGTGAVTGLRYDADGNVVKTVRFASALAAGQAPQDVVSAAGDLATDYVYDAAGRQIYTVGPDGAVVGSIYDRNGNLRQRTSYAAAIVAPLAALGPVFSPAIGNHDRASIARLLSRQAGDRTTTWAYDGANRQVLQVDALGAVTQTIYGAHTVSTKAYANAIGVAGWQAADFTPARVLGMVQGSAQDRVTVQTLDGAGRVVRTVDAAGYVVSREYDGTGQVRHVIEYAAQAGVPSAQDRHTRYTYDGAGRLVGKTDALGGQQYHTYDALGNRIAFTNEVGAAWTYAYDLAGRQIREVSPPVSDASSGIVTLSAYDMFGNLVSRTEAAGRPEQATTRYEYDADGRQTAVQTPITRTTGRYDTTGRLVQTTDANGVVTALAYDAAGRVLTRIVDPSGLNLITRYTYDALGNQLSVTDPQGVVTQLSYDAKGQLTRQAVDPTGLNLVTTFAYGSAGQQVSVTDPNGTVTRYEYDTLGRRVLEVVDPSTATHVGLNLDKRYTYDALGHVTSATDAQGHTTRYAYDAQGRQRFVLDAAGNLAETAYDAAGRVVRQTRYAVVVQAPDGLPLNATEAQINGLKRPDAVRDQTEHRIYDADNRVTATVNGAGDVVRFEYDGAGRVTRRTAYAQRLNMANWVVGTDPQPGTGAYNSPDMVTRTVYDAAGRVRYSIDGTGAVVSQRYDGNGNVTQRIRYAKRLNLAAQPLAANADEAELARRVDAEGLYDAQRDEQTRMRYDAAGRVTLSADGAGGVSQYLYDKAGRMLQSTRYATPIGDTGTGDGPITVPQTSLSDAFVRKVYDAAGRLTKEVDASGAMSTYDYDAAGRLVRETRLAVPADAYRNVQAGAMLMAEPTPVASDGDRITRHFLDRAGREVLTINAEGGATERFYDGAGQLLRVREGATQLTAAQVIQLESRRAQAGELSRGFIAQQAPWSGNDRITQNYYDAAGRLRFTRDALGHLQGYTYDGVGRLASRTVYMGEQSRDFWAEEGITGFTKTAGGEGLKPLYRLGGPDGVEDHLYTTSDAERAQLIASGWKDQGNVGYVKSQPASGAAPLYRLRPPGASTNHYYTASEELRAYARDVLGWIEEGVIGYIDVAPAKDNTALYQLYANGTNRHFHGLSRSEVDYALMPNPGFTAGVDRRESMAYDAAGNLIATTDAANQTESTAYDGTGRKTSFTNKAQSTWTYAYNAAGQMVQEISPQVMLADLPPGRLAGQMTQAMAGVVTWMDYDAMGHLTARTEAGGRSEQRTTRYEYDALGRQVRTIFPPVGVYQDEGTNLLANGRIGSGSRTEQTVETSSETRYDTLGRAVAGRAAGSTAWSYKAYDRAGHLAWDVDALGYVTGYTRNSFGETERLVRYAQNIATRTDGVLMREDEVRGAITARASSADRDILTGYDRLGRVTEVQEPYVFFVDNNTGEQGAGRKTTHNTYDALGNLTSFATNVGSNVWPVTKYGYDLLGRRTSTTDVLGYLTTDAYDAAGNVVRHVEYATRNAALGTAPDTGKGDRVTDTAYDVLGRKTSETRRGVGYTSVNAGAADIGGVLSGATGDLTTRYAYDALGNLLRTTDALGATTYQFYDALGRVRAIVTPAVNLGVSGNGQGKDPVTPLTEFRRDAHGNAVSTVQYAGGATVSGDQSGYTANAAPERSANRTSYTRFDAQGHTLETIDAAGNSHYYAYDAQGRLAKEWQNVSYLDDAGAWQVHSLWRAYRYDALGRQTNTYTPLQDSPDPSALRLGNTELQYNAFGEVTRKRVLWPDGSGLLGAMAADGSRLQGDEVYDYDNAGRLWRSNAGDGVMKIWAHDLQGRQTVQLVGAGRFKLDNYADVQQALGVLAGASGEFQRTDMVYDLRGQLVRTVAPERTSEKAMGITTRQNLVYGVITSTESKQSNPDAGTNSVVGQNQVDLVWRSLQDLGSGDVRITLGYQTADFLYRWESDGSYSATPGNASRSVVVSAEEAENGYSFKWKTPQAQPNQNSTLGIQGIKSIKVEKLDIFGNWTTIYDAPTTGTPVQFTWTEVPSPGMIWNEPGEGRKPIYRYYNRYNDTHLFSTSASTRDSLLNQRTGWLDEGIAGYVAEKPAIGLTALYRLGKAGTDVSVYTTSDSQRTSLLASGWEDRGIEGYVGIAGSSAAPAGMTKLYALQHHRNAGGDAQWQDGLYTTSLSDRRALLEGLPLSYGTIGRLAMFYGAMAAQTIEVSLPQDLVTKIQMEVRPSGGGSWRAVSLDNAQHTFGAAHRIELESLVWSDNGQKLSSGGYEYRLSNAKGGAVREVGTGTFAIYGNGVVDQETFPRVTGVSQGSAIIDGFAYRVLQWPRPDSSWQATFRYRTQGSNGAWTERTVGSGGIFGDGDGRSSNFGLGMQGVALNLGEGNFEYQIDLARPSDGARMRSTGTLSLTSALGVRNTTPPINVTNGAVTNNGVVGYLWSQPAWDRKPLYRYNFLQGNGHHITTADASVIAELDNMIARDQAAGSSPWLVNEGILGYVQVWQRPSTERLYQYIYGGETIFRLTANPADIGSYRPIYAEPKSDPNFWFDKSTWYQNAYQNDGFISTVPVEGTVPLYGIYNGNTVGNQSRGDYLTTTNEFEVMWPLWAGTAATRNVSLFMGKALIDGQTFKVLQWPQPEPGSRVKIIVTPPIAGGTPIFRHGDGRARFDGGGAVEGFVLDGLSPGKVQVHIEIEHPAVGGNNAYISRSDLEITVSASGAQSWAVQADTTPAYLPQFRAQNTEQGGFTNRPEILRGYDRWGNVISIDETQGLGKGTLVRTATMRYDANNQLIAQSRLHEDVNFAQSWATTQVYYDAAGRQVGVRDALGHLNAQVRDLAGNVVQERRADGGRMDYGYNAFGDKTSSAELMSAGRTVVTNYTYDQLSRLTQTSLGKAISRYYVGGVDGAVADTLSGGNAHSGNGVTGLEYTIAQTLLETVQYDEAGRKVRVINGNEEATRYRYDRMGNLVLSGQETVKTPFQDPNGPAVRLATYAMRYRYDALGRKIGQTDGMGMTQAWSYDLFGRMVGRTDSQSNGGAPVDFNFRYNFAGQLVHEDNTRVEPGTNGNSATNLQKNIDYRYDGAGQLIEIRDNYLGQTTRYEYDLAGNRVAEKMSQKTLLTSGLLDDVVYQDNHLVYDAQHRLRAVFDGRSDVRITYDLAGNRKEVKTHVVNTIRTNDPTTGQQERQVVHTSTTGFDYDAMNRQTKSREESSVNGSLTILKYGYDLAGNRVREQTFDGIAIVGSPDGTVKKTYDYVYDDLHRMVAYTGYGASDLMDEIKYDGAGRQVASRTLIGKDGGSYEYRYNRYDATGKLWDSRVVVRSAKPSDNQKVASRTDVLYHDVDGVTGLGYDAAGNLMGVRQDADGQITTTTYKYTYVNGGWQQSAAVTNRGSTQVATVTQRDANGFVVSIRQPKKQAQGQGTDWIMEELNRPKLNDVRYDRTFVNDASGTAVFVSQGGYNDLGEVKSSIANPASGYQGGVTGSSLTPGHVQRQLVANGEVLARYGDAPTQEENTEPSNNPVYVDTADFRMQAAQIRPRHKSMDPIAYTVVGGETLKDIARNVLGDASLWWRIAEANSLAVSGDGALTAGQTLTVPKLSLNANSVETFQPYDPSQATGSMDPVLPVPANGGGCGGLGKLIVMVVTIVVAAVTQQYYLLNYGASLIAAGAAGGAAGSIAGQVVGNVLGVQDGFSWKSVALSAIAAGVSGGLADSAMLGGTGLLDTVARAAAGNVLSQGIGVVTGLQDRFDWKSVVASAVGAGVGWGMNQALGLTDVNGRPTQMYDGVEKFARAGLSGFAAGTAAAVMRGGRISVQQVATDAFGNALGSSVADMMTPRDSIYSLSPKGMRGLGMQAPAEWGTPNWTRYDQFLNAFRNPLEADRSQDVQLAAGPGYTGGTGTSGRDNLSLSDNRGLESANSKVLSTLQAQGLGLKQNIDLLNAASAEAAALKEAQAAASAGNPRSMPPDRWIPDSSGNGGTTVGSRYDWQTNNAGNGFNVPRYDSMKSIDGLDAWFTFNSAGRAAAGVGAFALNAFTAIPGLVRGAWRLGQDAYGYASYALAPQRSPLTGQPYAYQPKSALMQSIEQQGVLGTVGAGLTGTVRNAPGIGLIGALAQPNLDWRNVGEQLANTGLAAAGGTMGKSFMGVANSGGKSLGLTELDPMLIRTTQTTVKQQGATIPKLVESMKQNGFVVEPDRLIDIVRMPDGMLTSLDNTRILAAQRAGVRIQARVFDHADALPNDLDYVSRFIGRKGEVPTTFGDAVQNRISNQSSTYRNLYPYGSPFIGSAY